ncbi:MAG: hypothetical protein K8T26_11500 [Lentisphaerae bacterium]|nr:hypothetical protein [Lentisphaerota bacterium]
MPIPIALLVADGAPINPMFFHDPPYAHSLLMPNSLARDFADICVEYGAKGKFSVLPMPCCLGGIDGKLNHVPPRHLEGFLKTVRDRIAPNFDITPEILTHLAAYRLKGGFAHVYEDEWVARASVQEMTDYIALALKILRHVGMSATGVTSPWNTGERNEDQYAQAIGNAQWRVHRRRVTWYFLHVLGKDAVCGPSVRYRNPNTGQVVVSIPATTNDPFWDTQRPMANSRNAARAAATLGVDRLLSVDGKSGRIADVIRHGCPVTILTHWPSLYSDGTCAGLWGLERLLKRLRQRYGSGLEWTTCRRLAARTARSDEPASKGKRGTY